MLGRNYQLGEYSYAVRVVRGGGILRRARQHARGQDRMWQGDSTGGTGGVHLPGRTGERQRAIQLLRGCNVVVFGDHIGEVRREEF